MPPKGKEPFRTRKTLAAPASSLGQWCWVCLTQTLPPTGDPEHGLGASAITVGTCTDSQRHSRKDDQLGSFAHFADSLRDGRDGRKTLLISSVPFLQGQQSPEGRGAEAAEALLTPTPILQGSRYRSARNVPEKG